MTISTIIYIVAGPLFLISIAAHLYVQIRLNPDRDSSLDDYYHEFEHLHPALEKYNTWHRITFAAIAINALLLFLTYIL